VDNNFLFQGSRTISHEDVDFQMLVLIFQDLEIFATFFISLNFIELL